ncbi:MAG TPA: hypothetical protein EYP55_03600 [Anaerolineae bacterium]|nr:hypothetical protein [Anaerolineae bacterium]
MSRNAHRPVVIYISAASDLMAEREALGRIIATLPVTLVWRIVQTPTAGESLDLEALQAADLHLLVMGGDIRAPVGLEWRVSRRARRPLVAFLKEGIPRTPAGRVFLQEAGIVWRPFTDAADLSRRVQRLLAEHLLRHMTRYALTPAEVERLEGLLTEEEKGEKEEALEGEGAGRSAVVLSRERFVPSEGVTVDLNS